MCHWKIIIVALRKTDASGGIPAVKIRVIVNFIDPTSNWTTSNSQEKRAYTQLNKHGIIIIVRAGCIQGFGSGGANWVIKNVGGTKSSEL